MKSIQQFIKHKLNKELLPNRLFHNWNHTLQVVAAVKEICLFENITTEDEKLLVIAAWFHDVGHISCYEGHEEISQKIAKNYLEKQSFD